MWAHPGLAGVVAVALLRSAAGWENRTEVAASMHDYCRCRVGEAEAGQSTGLPRSLFGPRCEISKAMVAQLGAPQPPQLSVVVLAYLPDMNYRIERLVCSYAQVRAIAKIVLVWNGGEDAASLPNATCAMHWYKKRSSFHATLPRGDPRFKAAKLEVVVEARNTLLNRYRQAFRIKTDTVLLQDDDIIHSGHAIEAFAWMHLAAPHQVLGVPPERDYNKIGGYYEYVHHPRNGPSLTTHHNTRGVLSTQRYSFLLGQTSILSREYLGAYLTEVPRPSLKFIVTHKPTCEDLTLHFFVSNKTKLPPVVFAKLRPDMDTGPQQAQMHTSVSRRAWNARRSKCLTRLVDDYGNMTLVKSKCRFRGRFLDLPWRAF